MPPLDRDDVEAGLKKKGFTEEDGDHRFYKLNVGDKYTGIFTKTSRGKKYKTLGDDLRERDGQAGQADEEAVRGSSELPHES